MSLKNYLKDLGYESVSRSAFVSSIGELVHVVFLGRDRHGQDYVEVKVWHERFAIPGEQFRPRDLATPIRGMVGPEGVISSWTWKALEEASEHIARVVKGFSACFGEFQDIRNAVGTVDESSPLWKHLNGPWIDHEGTQKGSYSTFRHRVLGSVSKEAALELGCSTFEVALRKLGFERAPDENALVFTQDRGELVDCIRFTTDLFQTFGQLEVFPWSRLVWRAERRLKGRYLGITTKRTEDPSSLWIRPIHEVDPACVDSALVWIIDKLRLQQDLRSTADFIAAIDPMYSTIRAQLAVVKR